MRLIPRCHSHATSARGFSLVELSVVVAIISVVATLGLEAAANFVNRTATNLSRERLKVVDDATARFFKVYGRLPCPAVRTTAPTTNTYGLEDCTIAVLTSTTLGGGLMAGAVPFRTLNLPMSYSLDGFNDKFNYIVTKNLTAAGGTSAAAPVTNRFATNTTPAASSTNDGIGGIEVRTGVLEQPCSTTNCEVLADPAAAPPKGAAYFIFSSGADQRGAVSDRGVAMNACNVYASEKRIDTQNCVFGSNAVRTGMSITNIPYNVFYDNRYNPGLNLVSYFDDVAVWRTKAQLW